MTNSWMNEHLSDLYVKKAKREGFRSRAAYKLLEIQEKDKILASGMCVVDLGAAPGGWSQVVRQLVGEKGQIIAVDTLAMTPPTGVHFIQGDFAEAGVLEQLLAYLDHKPVDVVLSDMAPNISGLKSVDQPKSLYLAELAMDCASLILKPGGHFLVKIFQGAGVDHFIKELRKKFQVIKIRKPLASRSRSPEIYVLGRGFQR